MSSSISNFKIMKKFIVEILIISALVIASGLTLYKLGPESKLANKVKNINYPLDIINLGTSHGNNFVYIECMKNGERINKKGNTLYYDLQNLIYLDDNNKLSDSAIIIIPVSYFVFGLGENREDRLPDNSFVNDYYYYLPKEQIYDYSETKKKSLIVFKIQKALEFFSQNKSTLVKQEEQSDLQLKNHAIGRAERHKLISDFQGHKKNIHYLDKIIETSISKGYRPILVTTPYYHYYNEFMGEEWLKDNYFNVMDSLRAIHNIDYLDYSSDNRFTYDNTLFTNSDHLNSKGKTLFSRIIFDTIYVN